LRSAFSLALCIRLRCAFLLALSAAPLALCSLCVRIAHQAAPTMHLIVRPIALVGELLQQLNDVNARMKAVHSLCDHLQSNEFCHEFWTQGGLALISSFIRDCKGNLLAYSLTAMERAISNGFGWDFLTQAVIDRLAKLIANPDENSANIRFGALKLAIHLTTSRKTGYPAFIQALKVDSESDPLGVLPIFHGLVGNLRDQEVKIQVASLELIHSLIVRAPVERSIEIVRQLDKSFPSLTNVSRAKLRTESLLPESRKLFFDVMKAKLIVLYQERNVKVDNQNPEHLEMLFKLWQLSGQAEPLTTPVSEKWKLLGFQVSAFALDR
jgi:hypothetical protein